MDPKEELDPKKELNLPQREMIVAMHAAHSEMGKKKLTIEVRSAGELSIWRRPHNPPRIYNADVLVIAIGQQASAGEDEGREVSGA